MSDFLYKLSSKHCPGPATGDSDRRLRIILIITLFNLTRATYIVSGLMYADTQKRRKESRTYKNLFECSIIASHRQHQHKK